MTNDDQRKVMLELIRDLFMWVRELEPSTPQHTRRQTEFAARLQKFIAARERGESAA
jgi:hypothetical protein